jgi:DNA-binding transcriptional LysR family regulator
MSKPALDARLPTRLKTRQLTLLLHLDERRSILRAAEAANMTQPAASKLLAELEDAVGAPLFVRHARGVEPTWFGDVLVRHARNAMMELHQAQEEIADLKSGLTGHASIGTVVTSATSLVPMAVAELKVRSPQLLVNIEMDFSEVLVRQLLDGKFDIVIARIYRPDRLAELNFEPFGEEPHAMYARASHPLVRERGLGLKDLVGQTWVLPPPGNVLRERLNLLFLGDRVDLPKRVVETSSLPVIISLLQMSEMVSALPSEVVRPNCEAGALKELPIRLDLRLGEAGIITRRDKELSPGALAMLETLRVVAARLYPRPARSKRARAAPSA